MLLLNDVTFVWSCFGDCGVSLIFPHLKKLNTQEWVTKRTKDQTAVLKSLFLMSLDILFRWLVIFTISRDEIQHRCRLKHLGITLPSVVYIPHALSWSCIISSCFSLLSLYQTSPLYIFDYLSLRYWFLSIARFSSLDFVEIRL